MRRFTYAASAACWLPIAAAAQPVLDSSESEQKLGSGVDRVLATADQSVKPDFIIWEDERIDAFIKPVIQLATPLVGYVPQSDREGSEFNQRVSTLLLARIGFEGEMFGFLSFRTLFERNLGFSLGRNGPVGTGIWEGTASWQARENYIRLSKWGLSLTAGILPDPASVDFVSENILDSFGMDPYVRDPLLVSGFNQGQSVLVRFSKFGLTAGVGFTGGNPLVSSLSFGFGGPTTQLGTLFEAPFRAISAGIPGSNIHMNLLTPSLTYDHDLFSIRTAAQLYWVDVDVTQDEPAQLTGYNLRATAMFRVPFHLFIPGVGKDFLKLYGSAAYRENDLPALPDNMTLLDFRYSGVVAAGGFDVDLSEVGLVHLGFGGNIYYLDQRFGPDFPAGEGPDDAKFEYFNLGVTYWLWDDVASAGFRWGRNTISANNPNRNPAVNTTDSFILSLRLII